MMGYLFMVLKVLYHLIFYDQYYVPFSESMTTWIKQFSPISGVYKPESSLVWNSTSECIEFRFQKFVILNFGTQNFSKKTQKTNYALPF